MEKKLLSLILVMGLGFTALAQFRGTSSIRSSYYDVGGKSTTNNNHQENDVSINRYDNRINNDYTQVHNTENVIESGSNPYNDKIVEMLGQCLPQCTDNNGNYKDSRSCKRCRKKNPAPSRHDFDYTVELEMIELSCNACALDPKSPLCTKCVKGPGKVGEVCEHNDKKCTEEQKKIVISENIMKETCVDCERDRIKADKDIEIAKIAADRDEKIARENRKAAKHKYKQRNTGLWDAVGKIAMSTAGVLAPLLVEKERTKQISSCHNSYSNSGADVVMQNRLAFESEIATQSANFLPLSTWDQMPGSENLAFMCNGGVSSGFAGGMGGPQFGMGGFNPYRQQGGGFNGFAGQQGGAFGGIGNLGLGNLFNNVGGMIPNVNFGANASAQFGMGGTPWSQGTQPYYGEQQGGYNGAFNQGYTGNINGGYNGGYNGGNNGGGGTGGFAF